MPFPNRVVLGLVMRVLGTRPPEKALRAQAAGLPEPVVEALVSDFVPESQRYYRDPAPETVAPAHRGYVCTTRDDELPEALQRSFARRLGVDRPGRAGDRPPADAGGPGRTGREDRLLRGQRGRCQCGLNGPRALGVHCCGTLTRVSIRLGSTVINCADIETMTDFWSEALGLVPDSRDGE